MNLAFLRVGVLSAFFCAFTVSAFAQLKPKQNNDHVKNDLIKARLVYQSVFDGYQKFDSPEILSWQQRNALVGKIGGWRVYAKEGANQQGEEGTLPAVDEGKKHAH